MTSRNGPDVAETDIAIVGMAGRFPGARDIEEFWTNIRSGVESLTAFSDEELAAAGVPAAMIADPDYVKSGFVMPDMDMFDAGFFGYSPRDASIMDPQHRHFLELAWAALEHAGHTAERFEGSIGVYAGCGTNAYLINNLLTNPALVQSVGFFLLRHTGNDKDFLATRASYEMNLRGPSVNVQTACSTSLVAVHQACQSLLNAECDMALAGGVTIKQPHRVGYLYREGEIMSPDGHCRAFDAKSEGTVFGSGAGIVVLRRLADAIADGDTVYAVIKGSAINNDGSLKVGYLAPSVDGQAQAIAEAIAIAGVDPRSVNYVETHGTGTPVGDPIEIAALTQAFRRDTDERGFCGIGSLKTNIGHLDTAAGIASLIKVVQALVHRELPPSLHFEEPNPSLDLAESPFYVNATLAPWAPVDEVRRAGVSSLGAGGTNAHVILEEAPEQVPAPAAREWQLLLASAKTASAADQAALNLARHLRAHPEQQLADVAYTTQVGRVPFAHRRMIVARSGDDAAAPIEAGDVKRLLAATAPERARSVSFMFAGGGAQYAGMGADLYRTERVYREAVDRCLTLLGPELGAELRTLITAVPADATTAAEQLERPSRALPALFTTQYALAQLLESWNIRPSAMIGHSMGEYTAAHLAGVFSLEDALRLVALRGRLFERVPEGGMLSVALPAEELQARMSGELSIAAVNAPELCVASGPVDAIEALERQLEADEIDSRRVRINIAAHSAMLAPIMQEFGEFFRRVTLMAPVLPFISNVSGTWITAAEATDPGYWVRHLRQTVRFAEGVGVLASDGNRVLLEVGPGRTLATLAKLHPLVGQAQPVLTSMRHPDEIASDVAVALGVVGQLWLHGAAVDLTSLHAGERRRRVGIPTYPFEHRKHWVEPGVALAAPVQAVASAGRRASVDEWLYQPSWKRTVPPAPQSAETGPMLLFHDVGGFASTLAAELRSAGRPVISVLPGERFGGGGSAPYTVNPASPDDHDALIAALAANGGVPAAIVHAWSVTDTTPSGTAAYAALRDRCFFSLLYLAQSLGREDVSGSISLDILSNDMQQVAGEAGLSPVKAMLLGPCRVIGKEFPSIRCRSIDIVLPPANGRQADRIVDRLVSELSTPAAEEVVAYRGADRWVQTFETVVLSEPASLAGAGSRLRDGGVYLITGGLGGIGSLVAEQIAKAVKAKIVLIGRSALPSRAEWASHLAADGPVARGIRTVQSLEALGAEVMTVAADVTDLAQTASAVEGVRARFGGIDGVVHAAGVLDDGLIMMKDAATAARVLAPKVLGTLVLDEALGDAPLDFFVLFSSRGSVAGVAGQVDYTAANAFLDAFAHRKSAIDSIPAVSLNWSAWQGVGMTASAGAPGESAAGRPVAHPLLDRCIVETDRSRVYETRLCTATHWLLDEHRIAGGEALVPGTGYLEIARAAVEEQGGGATVELSEVFFVAPFVVREGAGRDLRVRIDRDADGSAEFVILGRDAGAATTAGWDEHARGVVTVRQEGAGQAVDLGSIRARCSDRSQQFTGTETRREQLVLGPRWSNLRRVDYGRDEALASLRLPDAYAGEVEQFRLHPALLDVATACAQSLIHGFDGHEDFYVPVSYGSLVAHGPLPAEMFSHIRYQPAEGDEKDVALFNVTVLDGRGNVVVEIADFTMMRLNDRAVMDAVGHGGSERAAAPESAVAGVGSEGITPSEGLSVFRRIMSTVTPPQVIVSPEDLHAYLERLRHPVAAEPSVEPDAVAEEDAVAVGEIEAVLAAHSAVRQAVVLAKHDRPGTTRLMAYVVYDPGEQVTVSELRRFLRDKLPESMVPQHFVELDSLPLADDGRVDRGALPDPYAPADDHVAPRTPTERMIAEVWRELLGVERVGIHDNFLDVGGHSLLAMRVIARLAKKTGVRLNPSMLNLQTLEQIASECDQRSGQAAGSGSAPARATPSVALAPSVATATPAAAAMAAGSSDAGAAQPVAVPDEASPQRLTQRFFNAVKQTVSRN